MVLPHVVVMGFDEAGRVAYEHIYWDQATLLVQVGLLDAALLPVAAAEQAKRLLDPTHPANEMIYRSRWNPRQWRVEKFSGKDADRAASLYVTVGQIAFRQFLPSQRFTDARASIWHSALTPQLKRE